MPKSERTTVKKKAGASGGATPTTEPAFTPQIVVSEALSQVSAKTQERLASEVLAACSGLEQNTLAVKSRSEGLAATGGFVGDDCIFIDPAGNMLEKNQVLAYNVSLGAEGHYQNWERTDVRVRLVGKETAIMTGLMRLRGTFQGKALTKKEAASEAFLKKGKNVAGFYRDINVFVRRNGNWELVAAQVSKVVKKGAK